MPFTTLSPTINGTIMSVLDTQGHLKGIFTDGDLRRKLMENRDILNCKMSDFAYKSPYTISAEVLLQEAMQAFKASNVDTLIVTQDSNVIGMLDIQDLKF